MVKILSVLDDLGRVTQLEDGRFESGFWHRPPRDCDIIRLYRKDGKTSFLGGKIVGERVQEMPSGKKRKVFIFVEDAAEKNRTRPEHFSPAGCVAHTE